MQRQTFSVHKTLLQKTTKYFDKLLLSESGKKGLVFLNQEDPEIFRWFNDWLYTVSLQPACCTYLLKLPGQCFHGSCLSLRHQEACY